MINKNYLETPSRCRTAGWRMLLTLLLIVTAGIQSYAQISGYTFAQSSAMYVPITGGTVLATATANTTGGSIDGGNFASTGWPFTFTFNGTGYTGCNVNANGHITFGATLPTTGLTTPISSTTAYNGAVAAFAGDINGFFNIGGFTSEIRWEAVGTTPNQEIVIQWSNFRPAFTNSTTNVYRMNFQIRLHENGNVVIHYGPRAFVVGSTAISSTARQVGIRGATNAAFQNRTNGTGVLYTASTAGASNTSTQAFNTNTSPPGMPSDGLVYTYQAPAPCTTPAPGNTLSTANPACSGTNFTLSLQNATPGTGVSYVWESSPDGSTWTPFGGTSATQVASQTSPTYYHAIVTCAANSSSVTSNDIYITMLTPSFPQDFEAPAFPPCEWSSNNATYIARLTGASGFGVGTAATRFNFFNADATLNLELTTHTFTPTTGVEALIYDWAYADYTGGEVDSLEILYSDDGGNNWYSLAIYEGGDVGPLNTGGTTSSNFIPTAGQWATNSILLPANTNKIMFRGRSDFGNNLWIDNVTLGLPPACNAPTGISASNVTGTSADINWTCTGCAGFFILEYGPSGFTLGTGTVINPATAPQNLNSLSPATGYDVYIKQVCDGGATESTYAGPYSFSTNVCGSEVLLNCGDAVTAAIPAGNGLWNVTACGFNTPGREKLYTFTAATSGTYNLVITAATGGYIDYYYKDVALGCDDQNWTCIDDNNSAGTDAITLTGGVTYYLLLDPEGTGGMTHTFSIQCPAPPNCIAAPTSPTDGGTVCEGSSVTLSWPSAPGATMYDVYLDAILVSDDQAGTTYSAGVVSSGSHTWQVIPANGAGEATGCATWTFSTAPQPTAGTIAGPLSLYAAQPGSYTETGGVGGTLTWRYGTVAGGPYGTSAGTGNPQSITFSAPGTYYLVGVRTAAGCTDVVSNELTVVVTVQGDNVCDAIPLSVGINGVYTNAGATLEAGESVPPNAACTGQTSWCSAANQTVWFKFIAPASGRVSLHFSPGNWDSEIALWNAAACGDLLTAGGTLLAANDDSSGSSPFNGYIDAICLVPGQTYFVQVDGYQSTTSAFSLELKEESIDDGNACTIDNCDVATNTVTHTPVSVDDNNVCTNDACDPVTGNITHTPINIDDGIDCTTDACDPVTGVSHTPTVPGPITGPAQQCNSTGPGGSVFYISPVPGNTVYNWTAPAGMTIILGQGTPQITVSWTAAASNAGIRGPLCVTTSNDCGNGQSCVTIDIETTKPVQPNSISGPAKLCPGNTGNYSVAPVARAAGYNWSVPTGVTITSGAGTNMIAVSVDGSFTGGAITVSASNVCGTSPVRSKSLSLNLPATPGAISGQAYGLCNSSGVMYSIASVPSATSYQWTVTNGSINGSSTGTSISVDWGTFTNGSVSVVSINGCGTSSARNLNTFGAPATPGTISGPTAVCAGGTYHYSVATVPGTALYTWTAPAGSSIAGQGTKDVDITFGLFPANNQVITCQASNACGSHAAKTKGGITISICPRVEGSISATSLNVYPNPAKGNVNVEFNAEKEYNYSITLVDVTGRTVISLNELATEGKNQKLIDLSTYSSGVYTLVVTSPEGSQQVRLVVE